MAAGMFWARVLETSHWLTCRQLEHQAALFELKEKLRTKLGLSRIDNERRLAKRYVEIAPILKEQTQASQDLRALKQTDWIASLKVGLAQLAQLPVEVAAAFGNKVFHEAKKNTKVATSAALGIISGVGGGIALASFPAGVGIAGATFTVGAIGAGILNRK